MYLAPHHFQTQSRYFEDSIQFALSSLWYKPYGLAACQMDAEALQNGTVSVLHARGLFPDGLSFDIPGCDPPPEARNIAAAFSPMRDAHTVLLSIPRWRSEGRNLLSGGDIREADSRFVGETRMVADESHGRDEKPVELGRKNFQIVLDVEAPEGASTLPLARVRRDGSGRFVYDSVFVPPVLRIGASEYLMTMVRRLCDLLDEKSRAISEPRNRSGQAVGDYYRRDLAAFWLLHTIHSSLGGLRHQLLAKAGHPEELYSELARLGGALCCFALDAHPRDLPGYDHDALGECFDALERKIRAWLEVMVRTNCFSIPFSVAAPYFWTAAVEPRYLENSRWILEIQSKAGEAALITGTPKLVKVCSDRFVPELVRRALPGMTLTHLPVPPPAVPARLEAQYFGIDKKGPCWEHIVQTRRVGVYVPGEFPDPHIELHVVMEN